MRSNKYIDIRNERAINHFLKLGASLTVGNRTRVINGKLTEFNSLVIYISGGEFTKMSGNKFNKYLVENDLKL